MSPYGAGRLGSYTGAVIHTLRGDHDMSDPTVADLLARRFGRAPEVPEALNGNPALKGMAGRGSCRRFDPTPVATEVLETLAAAALAAPSKSDKKSG